MTQETGNQIDYLHYWHVVRRRLWMILALSVAVTGLTVIVVGNMKPIYSSIAVITLEHSKDKSTPITSIYDIDYRAGKSEMTGSEIEFLKSSRLLSQVVDELQLDQSPLYNPYLVRQEKSEGTVADLMSMFKQEQVDVTPAQIKASIIKQLKASLTVTAKTGTRVLHIKFEANHAEMAANLANALVAIYIQDNISYRQGETDRATAWMGERADTLKQKLDAAQHKLQLFIEQEKLVDVGGVAGLIQVELTALTNRAAESRLKLADLNRKYGSKHPKIISSRMELSRAEAALIEKKKEIRVIGRKQVQLKALQQKVDSANDLHEKFFVRLNEANEVSTRTRANARIIELAVPHYLPIKPNKSLIINAAFVISLLFGVALVLLLDILDSTIRSIEHVERRLGLSLLGILPRIDLKGKALLDVILDDSRQMFNESMRTIRTGIMLSALDNPHKVLLVTSSIPGEGKSTVSANLAINLGKMEKVLLMDCDFRRPSIAKAFGLSTSAPGLSELVAGTMKFKDCIHQSEKYGIDIFTAGTIPPNPLELLASERFEKLLTVLEKHYDRIIVDSPPVHAVSDSLVLSKYAKGMLFVVKSDGTSQRIIKPCIKRLHEANAPIIGVVLNQVDVEKKGAYGYGYGGYYDQYGYSAGPKV
ncbi:MAG: polysaccharide biosynthesis tyrosine autokinase [Mariprofundus sp.]|nr:polysaccharide biosynthesis tyrosine autokinase [Mariprofundus sp.]